VALVVLSPHPDDAVFSCWHLLERPDVRVVTVFTREPAPGTAPPRWDRITRTTMRDRLDEDRRALAFAGCEPVHLGFLDSQYRDGDQDLNELVDAIRGADGSELAAPAGIGGHSDHELVRDAALRLVGEGAAVTFFADLPYSTEFGWPPWVSGAEPQPHVDVEAYWDEGVAPIRAAGYKPKVIELSEASVARKIEAMRLYESQFPVLEGPFRRLTHPVVVRYEVIFAPADRGI
jgi:LmbE family N-acetylglucosaminyl deacetylase